MTNTTIGLSPDKAASWFDSMRVVKKIEQSKPADKKKTGLQITGLKFPLYSHQEAGLQAALPVLKSSGGFAYLHQIGAGKSLTALATFLMLKDYNLVDALIVVLPKSIVGTMQDQINLHLERDFFCFVWDSTRSSGQAYQKRFNDLLTTSRLPIFIINVEAWQLKNERLYSWWSKFTKKYKTLLVVDESHKIKTPNASRTKALTKLAKDASYKIIMTGSAVTNSPLDCYSQFNLLSDLIWEDKNYFLFRARYSILEKAYGTGGRTFDKVVGFKNLERLQKVIEPWSHRVNREDLEISLPDVVDIITHVELSDKQRRVYEELKNEMMSIVDDETITLQNKLSFFIKAQQITSGHIKTENGVLTIDDNPPKLQALKDDVEGHDEKAIIWCAFTADVLSVSKSLQEFGHVVTFYGQTSDSDRVKAIEDFTKGEARFFVATSAGATGLNLQADCRLQYFYGLFLSPETFEQAKGRTNRTGQTKKCLYKYLLARGTVDDSIYNGLLTKTDLMSKFAKLKMADIIDLM
jgi:SNF2 family DNA or RNA helicase